MKKNFNKFFQVSIVFFVIFAWIFSGWPSFNLWTSDVHRLKISPEIYKAYAANYLTNPSFTGGTTGWTLTTTVYDSTYYQDTAGSVKTATAVGRKIAGTGSAAQTISTNIEAGSTVKLSHYWSKQCVAVNCAINTIQVDIAKPSAITTWVTIWSDTSIPAFGSPTAWTGPSNLNVSSYFNETGQYNFRVYANLQNGNNASAQSLAWFDNINLDVTPPNTDQNAFRWRNDNGSESTATWKDIENAAISGVSLTEIIRLRLEIEETNSATTTVNARLEFSSDATSCTNGTWTSLDTSATAWRVTASGNITNGDPTTNQLTSSALTFTAGRIFDTQNEDTTGVSLNNQQTEWEWAIRGDGAANNTTYRFRITDAGTALNTYTNCAQLTTAAAATVSCTASTSTTDFGTLTENAVSTSTPNITITSTCTYGGGCIITVKDLGNTSNPGLDRSTSPPHLINSADATLAINIEGYGIQATTTGSLTLNPKYNKINNDVGGLTTPSSTNLATSTTSYADQTIIITHKAAISNLTSAGDYGDTITYSCTGN